VKTKLAIALSVALLVALVAVRVVAATGASRRQAQEAPRPALVPAAPVARGDVEQKILLTGSIRARSSVAVVPELAGRVEAVHVKLGDAVRAGQALATLDHDDIAWQAKGARAAVELARANLQGARVEHARTKVLHDGGMLPPAQLDAAAVRLAVAEAQLAQAEAAAGLAEEQVRKARIATPISGVVARRSVDVGAQVGPQAPVFAVEDVSSLKLESAVDAAEWARLGPGAAAEVTVDARPGESFRGVVSARSPSLDPATRRATVEIEIENASGKLLPGMFARAVVAGGRVEDALVVPREAVVDGAGGAVVWRLAGGKAEAVKPRLGASDGRRVVVLEGLDEGDVVATAGQASLAHGAPAESAESQGIRTASAATAATRDAN
jgi:RND family efflux transporter MFP subunit